MDNKVLIAIIAVVAVVAAACGAVVLLNHGDNGGKNTDSSILNVDSPGTIEGGTYQSVIIGPSVGDGTVIMKSVKILGDLIIRGGGSHSVELNSCEVGGTTTVEKDGGEAPRIYANNTQMSSVNAKSNTIFESTGTGSFESVNAEGTANVTVQGSDTKVDSVSMSAGTSLTVNAGSVNDVTMGDGTTMNVADGSVSNVNVGKGCSVTMQIGANGSVDTLTVADNVSVTTSGEQTEAKLNEATIKMDSNADGAAVTINGTEKHVHTYQLVSVDWAHMDKQAMTVTGQIECISCEDSQEGHSYEETLQVSAVRVEPTCTEVGSVTYSVHWGSTTMTTATPEVLPALGHDYSAEFVWTEGKESYWNVTYTIVCENERNADGSPAVKSTGNATVTPVTAPATSCTESVTTTYTATVIFDGQTFTDTKEVTMQSIGHSWSAAFNWSVDGKTCSVDLTCGNDSDHNTTLAAAVTSAVKTPATCTAAGTTTYTATLEHDGMRFTDTKDVEDIPALGHEYNVEFTWADDNSSASYVATCTHDRTHVEQGSVDSQILSSTPSTCTTDGSTTYSASVTLSDGVHSDQKTVVLPKSHHYEIVDVDLMSVESGNDQSLTILATLVCTVCDDQTDGHEIQVRLPVVSGSDSSPDCGNGTPGYLDMTLLYNGEELSFHRDIPAEHTYHISSVNTQDRDHPTVTLICRDCQHIVENIAATPVITDRVEPDCVTPGSYMYHVECTHDGIPYQSLPEPVIIPLLGHDYQFNWEWGPNNLTATLIVTCARDGCDFHKDCRAEVNVNTTATCTEVGDTVFTATANFLNKEKTDTKSVSGAPLGHDYHVTDVDWDTFDKNAMTVTATKVCSRCHDGDPGHSVTESVAVYVAITDPTCTLEGNRHYYVESPQENGFNESIPALGHDCEYTFEWSQDFASAIMHEVCTRDGCDYHKDYQASVNPVTTPSTCSVAGQTVYTATCTPDHGPQQTDTKTISLPLAEHTYVITEIHWNTLNQEARTVEVVKTCSVCDESAEGHTATETVAVLVETTPATCTEAGSNHFHVDGTELEGYDVAIPATGHHLTHHLGQDATCTEAGWQEFDTCDVCGHSTFAEIPALGHDLVHHNAKAPTVGEAGWDAYDTCNRGDYTTYVEIPALHGYTITVYGGLVAEKGRPATLSQITVPENTVVTVTYNGSDFGYWSDSYDEYIPGESFDILVACDLYVTAHDINDREYGDWAVESEPTCMEDGLMCRTSGEFREYRVIPALGHISDGVFVVDTPATCTTAGAGHTTCERCHGEIDEVIEATGHHHVFTTEVLADGPIVGKLKGVCSECGHTVLKDYIVPVYPTGDMVVTFDWDNARHDVNATLRDEVHTMWKFTDAQGVERQAYLYQIVRDIHHNGYISGVDVTTWVFWADYGAHSPVYIARHNDTTPVYGGQSNNASWAVAGYVDNMAEFAYFIDNLSAEVMIGGEEFHLTLGMDNGAHASALFDLYDKWADRVNEGMAGLYSIDHATYLGWDCTVYYNDDESFYVNSDNCCVRWATSNMINGIERGDIVRVVSVDTEFTKPFTQGYWNSSNFPLFSSYYFNSMPTLDNSTYFCVKLINGNYNSADFTQGSYRLNFFNGDSRNHIMWITPNLGSHEQLDRIEVLSLDGVWMTVPSVLSDGHYVFDIQDKSIVGLYRYMMENNPGRFVLPNDPAFNGVYIRCVTSKVPYDSTVTVTGGTFTNDMGEEVTTGGVYGGYGVYLDYDEIAGKEITGIRVTVNGGEPQTIDDYWYYEAPENSTVTIEPIYSDVDKVYVELICSDGGSIDKESGYYSVGDFTCRATVHYGYVLDGWYNITDGAEPSEVNRISDYETVWLYLRKDLGDQTLKVIFKPVTHAYLEAENYTEIYATNGFVHYVDKPVYVTALYGNPEYNGRMQVHADPNRVEVYRWDIKGYAEDPNSYVNHQYPAGEYFDPDVKYCGQLTTVKAVFEADLSFYQLIYNLNGAEGTVEGGTYANDEEIYLQGAPEREGYDFNGWDTAADGSGDNYAEGQRIFLSGNLTLYAQWSPKTSTVNVAMPNGLYYQFYNIVVPTITVTYGTPAAIPADAVTDLNGLTITGWRYLYNGETQTVAADGTGTVPYGVSRIVAVCSYITYTLHFDKNNANATGTMDDRTFNISNLSDGNYLTLSTPFGYTQLGYDIREWKYDGDTVSDTDGKRLLLKALVLEYPAEEHTFELDAQWSLMTYTLNYDKNSQQGRFNLLYSVNFTITGDAYLAYQANLNSNGAAYYFIGWNTKADGSGTTFPTIAHGADIAPFCTDYKITVYAQWAVKAYSVQFFSEPNAQEPVATQNFTYGNDPVALTVVSSMGETMVKDGLTFVGWDTSQMANNVVYTDGQQVSNLVTDGSALHLYAVWVHNTYTVHFDKNAQDATGEMADQTFNANEEKGLTPNAFEREGYTFVHWSTNDYNQGKYYENGESVKNLTTEESITLYAAWTENQEH